MRYLHAVQAHEKFLASGCYRFFKDGQRLPKTEAWTLHEHPDGALFMRVDADARRAEGKALLMEVLRSGEGELLRFDLRYENAHFEGGIKTLRASYHLMEGQLRVGYALNGAAREYREVELPASTLIDIPLLALRGRTVLEMAARQGGAVFVPMFEHAQLFPGVLQPLEPRLSLAGEDWVALGSRRIAAQRYRYFDRALSYWIDERGMVIKRVNAFRQQEFVVLISQYAQERRREKALRK